MRERGLFASLARRPLPPKERYIAVLGDGKVEVNREPHNAPTP